jgi:hypothetical protein
MLIGDQFRTKTDQYACKYEKSTKSWLIVDLWHEKVATLEQGAEVPQEAIKVLSDAEAACLFKEAARLRKLPRMEQTTDGPKVAFTTPEGETSKSNTDETKVMYSYQLKNKAIAAIERIINQDVVQHLSDIDQ